MAQRVDLVVKWGYMKTLRAIILRMKKSGKVKRLNILFPYLVFSIGMLIIVLLVDHYVVFDITLDALRLLAVSIFTIAGILIGLVATVATSIVRVSTSQKQFYQGILVNESQWLRDWFAKHPPPGELEAKVEEILHLIYRHSTTPAASEEEVIDKMAETLLPLVTQTEGDEFAAHLDGIGATLSQTKASKDRMELGAKFVNVLWTLGFTVVVALIMLLCTVIPTAVQFMTGDTYAFAFVLVAAALISVAFLVWFTTEYLRTEAREIKRIKRIH